MKARRVVRALAVACLAVSVAGGWGCGASPEVVRRTVTERSLTDEQIDEDPWALLPSGAVTWAEVDAKKLFAGQFGQEASVLLADHLPLARGAGFDPARDIERIHLGVYATAGSDVAVVARGTFDGKKIRQAVAENPTAAHGREILSTRFAGFDVYVVDGAALAPITNRTLVFGSEIGVRRVLERIEESRIRRALPVWYEDMLKTRAPLSIGVDLDAQPVPATVRTRLAFLQGLRAGRLLGNFESPGLNLAGTLTYDKPESASAAAEALEAQVKNLDRYALLLNLFKIPQPVRRLETRAVRESTEVAIEVEGRAVAAGLARFDQIAEQALE